MTKEELNEIIDNSNFFIDSENEYDMKILEVLKKQVRVKCEDIITSDNEYIGTKCNKCGYLIVIPTNYCPNCGQRIADWSE